jgi:excisionase family DNA binding protein
MIKECGMSGEEKIIPAAVSVMGAAQYLSISRPTLYRLMNTGDLRSGWIGRRRIILKRDLDDFLERCMATDDV